MTDAGRRHGTYTEVLDRLGVRNPCQHGRSALAAVYEVQERKSGDAQRPVITPSGQDQSGMSLSSEEQAHYSTGSRGAGRHVSELF
mgnify:CR=1 FL=1